MHTFRSRNPLGPLVVGTLLAGLVGQDATAEVRVVLVDGRIVEADELGAKTNDTRVELVVNRDGIRLGRTIARERIRSLTMPIAHQRPDETPRVRPYEEQDDPFAERKPQPDADRSTSPIPPAQPIPCSPCLPYAPTRMVVIGVRRDPLAAYAHRLEDAFPNGIPTNERGFALWLMREATARDVLTAPPTNGEPAPAAPVPPQPAPATPDSTVVGIEAVAATASGGGNVDRDVLDVVLQAVDALGRPTHAAGTVSFRLVGREQELVRAFGTTFAPRYGRIRTLGDWTRRASSGEPTSWRLPLAHPLPDHDVNVAALGDLHITFAIPGQGVFSTIVEDVPLRSNSLVRNGVLAETGSAFPPHAVTVGRRRTTGPRVRNPSAVRPNGGVLTVQP